MLLKEYKGNMHNHPIIKFTILFKKQIFILYIFNLLSSSLLIIGPYLSKLFIDIVFINKNLNKFWELSILGGVLFILCLLIKFSGDIVRNKISVKIELNLIKRFVKKIYSLDLNFFQINSVGENTFRLLDIKNIANFLSEQYPVFLVDIFKTIIILGISFSINPRLAILLIILSPLFILHNIFVQKRLMGIYGELWKHSAIISKEIHQAFSKILIIKSLDLECHQKRTFLRSLLQNIRLRIKSFRWVAINSMGSDFLSKAVYGSIALYGGWLIVKGRISLGSYTAVMLYFAQLVSLSQALSNRFEYFTRWIVSSRKFFEIIESSPQIRDLPGARRVNSLKNGIQFKDVWFGYNGKPVIKGISFIIPLCSWVGIAGPSGSGKTTLINLILRLYDPEKGNIYLDGLNLKELSLSSLRGKIAVATQQPLLFDVSVKENICYGLRNVAQQEIIEAAKIACIHNYIEQLPNGYDTLIGEDACRLSQGIKQRITIARAILRKPDLLILDEATSSIDSFTEEKIFGSLRYNRQGLSTLVISHRLFSIENADRTYFLKGDGSLEEGTHIQLLTKSAAYKVFFHNQSLGNKDYMDWREKLATK